MIVRAEGLNEVALWAGARQVDGVHLVAALHAQQARQQPDRPGARDQRASVLEERALRDPVDLLPRLGQHRRRLQQYAELAQPGGERHGELRLQAPALGPVSVPPNDPALGELVVAAHVPFPGRARRTGHRIRATDDPDDEITPLEP